MKQDKESFVNRLDGNLVNKRLRYSKNQYYSYTNKVIVSAVGGFGQGTWVRNVQMFADRFGTKWTWEGNVNTNYLRYGRKDRADLNIPSTIARTVELKNFWYFAFFQG